MCREQAAEFRSRQSEFDALKVKVLFISTGLPAMVDDFVATTQVTNDVYVDPRRDTYKHLGFKHGPLTALNLKTVRNAARAKAKGFVQGRTQGDPWQQGGVLVFGKGGALVYGYASEVAGDHPPMETVLAEAKKAAGYST